ncbi:VanW family protein [Candidatus Uhrbacteria bacterium]|nr:VanW family protein [Candidatus Uhrbacteria bacterium]
MNRKQIILVAALAFGAIAFLLLSVFTAEVFYARLHENRMFPGLRVLGVRLDGMTKNEARQEVQKRIDQELSKGLRFRFNGKEIQIQAVVAATDPDISRELIRMDIEPAIERAFAVGRDKGWFRNVFEQLDARIGASRIPVGIARDDRAIGDALAVALKDRLEPARDASFSIVVATGSAPFVHIEKERSGIRFDQERALRILTAQAERLTFEPITLDEIKDPPRLRGDDLEPLIPDVQEILARPPLAFTYEKETYRIPTSTLAAWLTVVMVGGRPRVEIDEERFGASLRLLAPHLETPVKNGSLVIADGRITSFVPGTQGTAINATETLAAVTKNWPGTSSFPIVVETKSGSLLGEDPERLGIKEIIGVGTSNFAGSPMNRRKNIRKGVEKVNGALIAPGEEFSLLKTLGSVDGENGWFPELVIKGNKTTPEFGGGLCQIGTTTFRGALNSGLDITVRQNHSYRVRYYEPAGTDATIYEPAPDFRFINDTGHHVLINAYMKGDTLVFEYWGTKDGRKVDPIKPRIYNIVAPPPMKLIETLDLPPGKKNCTETEHAGADAEFTYRVTGADGTLHEEVFKSHYRPWQAVCLIGVEKLTEPPAASSTDDGVGEPGSVSG